MQYTCMQHTEGVSCFQYVIEVGSCNYPTSRLTSPMPRRSGYYLRLFSAVQGREAAAATSRGNLGVRFVPVSLTMGDQHLNYTESEVLRNSL